MTTIDNATVELVADCPCVTGENPLWQPDERRLYWVDIPPGVIYRYDPTTGRHESVLSAGAPVGGFTLQADGSWLLFMARGSVRRWRDGEFTTVIEEIPEEREFRFNDVIADPAGRVFCGTYGGMEHRRHLYRLDPDRSIRTVVDGVDLSNGLGFTPDRRGLYYTETAAGTISYYDYDEATGAIANRRLFAQVDPTDGLPDGLTVDTEGCVWSARWDGGCIVRYRPDGVIERRYPIPTPKVTSLIFGGDNYTDLYVTTAGGGDRSANGPLAGSVFRLRPGVRGLPEFRSRIVV